MGGIDVERPMGIMNRHDHIGVRKLNIRMLQCLFYAMHFTDYMYLGLDGQISPSEIANFAMFSRSKSGKRFHPGVIRRL